MATKLLRWSSPTKVEWLEEEAIVYAAEQTHTSIHALFGISENMLIMIYPG